MMLSTRGRIPIGHSIQFHLYDVQAQTKLTCGARRPKGVPLEDVYWMQRVFTEPAEPWKCLPSQSERCPHRWMSVKAYDLCTFLCVNCILILKKDSPPPNCLTVSKLIHQLAEVSCSMGMKGLTGKEKKEIIWGGGEGFLVGYRGTRRK